LGGEQAEKGLWGRDEDDEGNNETRDSHLRLKDSEKLLIISIASAGAKVAVRATVE
jgi:hypothetical protein